MRTVLSVVCLIFSGSLLTRRSGEDEAVARRLTEEIHRDKRVEQRVANFCLEAPEAPRLRPGQMKAGDFEVFSLDDSEITVDLLFLRHGAKPSNSHAARYAQIAGEGPGSPANRWGKVRGTAKNRSAVIMEIRELANSKLSHSPIPLRVPSRAHRMHRVFESLYDAAS
jgi:hypothetical protein